MTPHQPAANRLTRFSDRVENYVKYRPSYPQEIIPYLIDTIGLSPTWKIADIGSGTGISTKLFLENGNEVYAIEPNDAMREASEHFLSKYSRVHIIKGTAEETTLTDDSIDLIIAGQAFHWFEQEKCKAEFRRILHKDGFVLLMWNERLEDTPFLSAYEDLLQRFATDYNDVKHNKNIDPTTVERFFSPQEVSFAEFPNAQPMDFDGIKGRLLSSSYMPQEDSEQYPEMIEALQNLFDQYQESGSVSLNYMTRLWFGNLG